MDKIAGTFCIPGKLGEGHADEQQEGQPHVVGNGSSQFTKYLVQMYK